MMSLGQQTASQKDSFTGWITKAEALFVLISHTLRDFSDIFEKGNTAEVTYWNSLNDKQNKLSLFTGEEKLSTNVFTSGKKDNFYVRSCNDSIICLIHYYTHIVSATSYRGRSVLAVRSDLYQSYLLFKLVNLKLAKIIAGMPVFLPAVKVLESSKLFQQCFRSYSLNITY